MNEQQLIALLEWRMCSDPWPGGDREKVDELLDELSRLFGFAYWVNAYHELCYAETAGLFVTMQIGDNPEPPTLQRTETPNV